MGTYFLLNIRTDSGQVLQLGPYLSIKAALEIMADHTETLLLAQQILSKSYHMELIEAYPTSEGWATVAVRVIANETNCREMI